jgi:N-acetylglutamate synthase-like GNAT family acetyltransferase
MAFIRCTKKLLAELPLPMEKAVSKSTILGDWHANLLRIERRKCVLFTNDETLFSVFIPMLRKPHFENLASVFLDNLIQTLKSEAFNEIIEQVNHDYTGNLIYSTTNNRSVLGSMNDIAHSLPFFLEREGGIENVDPFKINHILNRMPLIKKSFFSAVEGLEKKLSRPSITFKIIAHDSPEYKMALHLSEGILRKPLGLTFSQEELAKEKDYVQVVGFMGDEVVATVALVPEEDILRMRRVAVRNDLQKQGIASAMMKFCEDYAFRHGFKEIYCHARETAVPFYKKNDYLSEGDYFEEQTIPHQKMRKTLARKA